MRREHPVFRPARFLEGRDVAGSGLPDVWWFRPDGRRMTQRDWRSPEVRQLGAFLNGKEIRIPSPRGEPLVDDDFLLLFNADAEPAVFTLPPRRFGRRWATELSTAEPAADEVVFPARGLVPVGERSIVVLRSGS